MIEEKTISNCYSKEEFPLYNYFYYSDSLVDYIKYKIGGNDKNKYPLLELCIKKLNHDTLDLNKYTLNDLYLFNTTLNLINQEYFENISREYAKKTKLKDVEIYINNMNLIDKFIDFFNSLDIKYPRYSKSKIILTENNSLSDFLLDENNVYGRIYEDIYKNFIKMQNETLEILFDLKIEKGIFDINCKDRIDIQKIKKEEIFNLNLSNNLIFIDILYSSSYRKILDDNSINYYTKNYQLYKEYEIDYDFIEEKLTDLILKGKKLLNQNITRFNYKPEEPEVFTHQVTDLISQFKRRYDSEKININDKINIYNFYISNKNDLILYKIIINDFLKLIKYLNYKKIEMQPYNIHGKTKIYEIIKKKEYTHSKYFMELFENYDEFTINKITKIFDYYLKLIYKDVFNEIKKYQKKLDDYLKDSIIKSVNNYFTKNKIISKKDLSYSIRLFTMLTLFQEENKDNKIKLNNNNIANYLKYQDLWEKRKYYNKNFEEDLNELKTMDFKINGIIFLYEILGGDIEEKFSEEINYIKKIVDSDNKKKSDEDSFIESEEYEEYNNYMNSISNEHFIFNN